MTFQNKSTVTGSTKFIEYVRQLHNVDGHAFSTKYHICAGNIHNTDVVD